MFCRSMPAAKLLWLGVLAVFYFKCSYDVSSPNIAKMFLHRTEPAIRPISCCGCATTKNNKLNRSGGQYSMDSLSFGKSLFLFC